MWISGTSFRKLEKFQHSSGLANIIYNCTVFITSNYRQILPPNSKLSFVVSRIVEVSLNKIALWLVSWWMIGKPNERSLLVMILEINVWDKYFFLADHNYRALQNFLISLKKIELTELPTGCLHSSIPWTSKKYYIPEARDSFLLPSAYADR